MNTFTCFFAGVLGLGGPEVLLIFAVLLLLFGGSKLPELAKGLGKSIREFKQASRDEPEGQIHASRETIPPVGDTPKPVLTEAVARESSSSPR